MEMKLARHSPVTALAASVLPQPGGPYSSTPPALRPMAAKARAGGWGARWRSRARAPAHRAHLRPRHVGDGREALARRAGLHALQRRLEVLGARPPRQAPQRSARCAHRAREGLLLHDGRATGSGAVPSTSMAACAYTRARSRAAGAPTPMSASAPSPTPSSPAASIARSSAASRSSSFLKTRASATAAASLASAMRSAPT